MPLLLQNKWALLNTWSKQYFRDKHADLSNWSSWLSGLQPTAIKLLPSHKFVQHWGSLIGLLFNFSLLFFLVLRKENKLETSCKACLFASGVPIHVQCATFHFRRKEIYLVLSSSPSDGQVSAPALVSHHDELFTLNQRLSWGRSNWRHLGTTEEIRHKNFQANKN